MGLCGPITGQSSAATFVATVTVINDVPPSAAVDGVTVQVAFAGAPEQVNAMVPGTPTAEVAISGYTACPPATIVCVVLPFALSPKSTPTPLN